MKYIVYCTTNLVNDKIYIGVHATSDPEKFDGYIGNGVYINNPSSYNKPKTLFQNAVKKYGPKNFKRSILYIFDDEEDAYLKESELVNFDFIKQNNNYNMALGGKGGGTYKGNIYQFDLQGNMIKKWDYVLDIVDTYNKVASAIYGAMIYKESLAGYFWSREPSIDIKEYSKPSLSQPVYQYNIEGTLIRKYDSLYAAGKESGIIKSSIQSAINRKTAYNNEYYFSYELVDKFIPKQKVQLRNRTFYIYDLDGKYLTTCQNIQETIDYTKCKNYDILYLAMNNRNGVYKDYQIKLEYFESIPPVQKQGNRGKSIDAYTIDGQFIKTYSSINQAVKDLNVPLSNVKHILKGMTESTKGYTFKFHEEIKDIV